MNVRNGKIAQLVQVTDLITMTGVRVRCARCRTETSPKKVMALGGVVVPLLPSKWHWSSVDVRLEGQKTKSEVLVPMCGSCVKRVEEEAHDE